MKNLFRYTITLFVATALCLTTACDKEKPEYPFPIPGNNTPTPTPPQEITTSHTLMFYFVGTTLNQEFAGNLTSTEEALKELSKEGGALYGKTSRPRVIVYKQKSRSVAHIFELKYGNGECMKDTLATYDTPAVMPKENITAYLNKMMELAPAPSYGLVIGSHSRGWIPIEAENWTRSIAGIGGGSAAPYWQVAPGALVTRFLGEGNPFNSSYPSGHSNYFDIWDLADALEATQQKFKYIIYDACLMANVETLYDLRNCSEYAIASVSEIMGIGFPYKTVIPHLLGDNGASFNLDGVCEAYNYYYKVHGNRSGSVSLVDNSQLEALAEATKAALNETPQMEVEEKELQYYDGLKPHLYYDFGQYINAVCPEGEVKEAFNAQLAKSVPCKYTLSYFYTGLEPNPGNHKINTEAYSGLATSLPSGKYRTEYPETSWYKATH